MKKLIFTISLLFASHVFAGDASDLGEDCMNLLNRQTWTGALAVKCGLGPASGSKHVHVLYDFAKNGGATGSIKLGHKIPNNAVIERCFFEIITAFTTTTGTGRINLTVESNGDLKADVDADTLSGINECLQAGAAANMVKLTTDREIILSVSSEAITAGKFVLYLDYRDGL